MLDSRALAITNKRPHVVILGAGASKAAFPNGDKNGIKLPVMNDLIEMLDLGPVLDECEIGYVGRNFEEVYAELSDDEKNNDAREELEKRIFGYFAQMELPDEPTLYDHLVLCLREKDLIATFNWDPFLWQAMRRNRSLRRLPKSVPLHGTVAFGVCYCREPIVYIRPRGWRCEYCGESLQDNRLLYPVTQKGYANDKAIKKAWDITQAYFKDAYYVTIFGYSAPVSDAEAMQLLKDAWGDPNRHSLAEIQIIDTREEEEIIPAWSDFICRDHCNTAKSFYETRLVDHPRRTCDSFWDATMDMSPRPNYPLPEDAGWDELREWVKPLLEVENQQQD